MKLQKYEYRNVTELTEVELTEELAQACERDIKKWAAFPEQVPHISMQTLAQCWTDNVNDDALHDYVILVKCYSDVRKSYLTDEIKDWLQEMMWQATETQSVVVDSESIDSTDDVNCSAEEYQTLLESPNPDFANDNH